MRFRQTEQFCGPERDITLNCDRASCHFSARGTIRKINGSWQADEQLEQSLIDHHVETGGGNTETTTTAHRVFIGQDDKGDTHQVHASSYGVEVS